MRTTIKKNVRICCIHRAVLPLSGHMIIPETFIHIIYFPSHKPEAARTETEVRRPKKCPAIL